MEENKKFKLFRERSLESIESPESMNDYLQVTSPGIWIVLAAVIAILVGAVLWTILGRINTYVNVAVISDNNNQICYVPYDKLDDVMTAGIVVVGDKQYALHINDDSQTVIIAEDTNPYIRVAGNFEIGDIVIQIPIDEGLTNGIYKGTVMTESLQPIKLLLQ